MDKVKVTVGSTAGVGKSTVVAIIKNALQDVLDNVEFDGGTDFQDERGFDYHIQPTLEDRCHSLNSKGTVVEIEEVQFNRVSDVK